MRRYHSKDTVYIGDKKYTVDEYQEECFMDPATMRFSIPGYLLIDDSGGNYYTYPSRTTARVGEVHHLSLSARVRRIEEILELD